MATNPKKSISPKVNKTKPTVFPLGFGVGKAEEGIFIVNFYDHNPEGDAEVITIIESFAMAKSKALDLIKALQGAIEHEEE